MIQTRPQFFNLSTRNQKILRIYYFSHVFSTPLLNIYLVNLLARKFVELSAQETFRFVDKRIQCLSSEQETKNDFSRREFQRWLERKLKKSLNKIPAIYHGSLKLIPVCVQDRN